MISQVSAQTEQPNKVILFDESHDQFFNRSLFSQAIEAMEDLENVEVYFTDKEFTDTILSSVDLLIITNPGTNDENIFSQNEKKAIGNWMNSGEKGLFMLCNPFDKENTSLTGNPVPLNDLVASTYLQVGETSFYFEAGTRSSNIVRNSSDYDDSPYLLDITITKDRLQYLNSTHDNMTLVVTSCSLESKTPIVSSGYDSYSVSLENLPDLQEENPCVHGLSLAGYDSKVALSGSTLMFSDLPSAVAGSWYESGDNSLLFTDTIKWLLGDINQAEPSLLDITVYVPLALAAVGLLAMLSGGYLSKKTRVIVTSDIAKKEIDAVESEEIIATETYQSKRQRKFAQRKKTANRRK